MGKKQRKTVSVLVCVSTKVWECPNTRLHITSNMLQCMALVILLTHSQFSIFYSRFERAGMLFSSNFHYFQALSPFFTSPLFIFPHTQDTQQVVQFFLWEELGWLVLKIETCNFRLLRYWSHPRVRMTNSLVTCMQQGVRMTPCLQCISCFLSAIKII